MCIDDPSSGISIFFTSPSPFPMFRSQRSPMSDLSVVGRLKAGSI
nr:MAG TPA: hypothetical protein [Caudoviricetes sp.]